MAAEHEHHKAAGGGLTKKMGPLPVWAWGLIIGVGIYFLYERYSAGSSSTSTAGTAALDPNSIDPNTGLTYGSEESAAENANAATATSPASGGLDNSGGTTSTGEPADTFDQNLSNMEELLSFIQGIDPNFGTGVGAAGGSGANGSGANGGTSTGGSANGNASPSGGTGSNSPTMTSSTPPPTTPTVHTQLASPNIQPAVTTPDTTVSVQGITISKGIGAPITIIKPKAGVGEPVKSKPGKTIKNGIVTG